MHISIVGFGYIGAVIGAVLSSRGHQISAIDSQQKCIDDLNAGICRVPEPKLREMIYEAVGKGLLTGSTTYDHIIDSDVVLVTVGTPLSEEFDADLSAIRNVFMELSTRLRSGQLVMLKSTVPPGVTRLMFDDYLKHLDDVYIAFSPERLAEGNAIEELQNLPIIVGGINEESTQKCSKFWSENLGVDVIEVSSCESAELVKLANNQWIDLNIALANELAVLCDSLPYDLDVLEIIRGANSLRKGQHFVNYLTPSIGVGGYCLTKDPWFFSALGDKNGRTLKLPSAGRAVNDNMPYFCVEQILKNLASTGCAPNSCNVAILGYSFKSNSGDTRFSPMIDFVDALLDKGFCKINVFDSTINDENIAQKTVTRFSAWEECVSGADCVVFGASHDDIASIPLNELANLMKKNGLVFDGRRYFSKDDIFTLKELGIRYLGVGRSFS